jgi:hypothetical protein
MSLDGLLVLINPIDITCFNDVSGSLVFQNLHLLFSPDNVQQRDFFFLTVFVEHSSQGRGSSCVDDTFSSGASVAPFSESVDNTNNTDWVDDARCC